MAYQLGPVDPFVEKVAYILGPMFGITTIGGHRDQGSVPNSDHPKGRALDFMVPNQSVGDALSGFAIANAKLLGIKYIVWNHRSWNPTRGTWVAYTATSNPHTDHVHISFKEGGDPGTLEQFVGGFAAGLSGGLTGGASAALDILNPLSVIVNKFLLPNFWRRIATGVIGVGFIVAGLLFIARRPIISTVSTIGDTVGSVVGTAVQGASFGVGAGVTGGLGGKAPVSATPVTKKAGPYPPKMLTNTPTTAVPTTSALPPEIYAPTSAGGTFNVTTAKGRVENPTEYRRPKGQSLIDLAGTRNPAPTPKKRSKKGKGTTSVSAPMRQQPYGGQ